MASISISYSDEVGSCIEGNHEYILNGYQVTCYSDSTSDSATASSILSFPSLNIIKSSMLNSLTVVSSVSKSLEATGGYSLSLFFDGSSYTIDSDGKVSSEAISHLNNYKSQKKEFPSITLKLDSWLSRPPAYTDGSKQSHTFNVKFSSITIEATIQGGKVILRPNADISVEHVIKSGFSGVYQLINEEVADDDATKIGDIVEAGTDEKVSLIRTSVVSFPEIEFSKKSVVLMKPVSRHLIKNPSVRGYGRVGCSVYVGDVSSSSFSDTDDTGDAYVTCEKWSIFPNSSVVAAVNSFVKANKVLPEIQLSLTTTAESEGPSGKAGNPGGADITQAYLEIIYEDDVGIGVLHKVGDTWKQAQTAYVKRSGAWVEISEEECKTLLSTSFVTK